MVIDKLIENMELEEKISLLAAADLWHTVPIERLNIPAMRVTDGPNGARGAFGNLESTSACTPVGVALGATWNPNIVEEIGQVLGEETISKGAHILLAPTVNIQRTPIAGRNFECFSEDPYLSGILAGAIIKGIQSKGVGACIKHFVCNDQEYERFSVSVEVQGRPLHEIYLEPFRLAIRAAKPWAVMSAYNRINGVYASEDDTLLKTILRDTWGYKGIVISDWNGTYSANVLGKGVDIEFPGPARWMGQEHVKNALRNGSMTEEDLNDHVRRLLETINKTDLFEDPDLQPDQSIDKPEHQKVIRRAAQEAIVLLRNENDLLPFVSKEINTIAVIGENAFRPQILGGGSSAVAPHYIVSPLEGIRNRAGKDIQVGYAMGCYVHRNLPAPCPVTLSTADQENGLRIEFFDNLDFSGSPAYEVVSERVYFGWFDDCVPNVTQERFSVRMSGYFTPQETGTHTFGLNIVGKGRLFLEDQLVIDLWTDEKASSTAQIAMHAGQSYPILVEYKWQGDPHWRSLALGHLPPQPRGMIAEAVELASRSDVVVLLAGLNPEWEAESFDRPNMYLPGKQNELIEQVAKANPNTVVVLNCGSPVEMPWLDQVAGVIQLWYNSQEQGNALADVLFGDISPSGKLPMTFPKRLQDNPTYINFPGENGKILYGEGLFVGYRYYDKKQIEPLFPFGYGLSFTTFEYSNLHVDRESFDGKGDLTVQFDLKNTGSFLGKEIAQVYVRDVNAKVLRPEKELKAFEKIYLDPGETKTVKIILDKEAFWFFDDAQSKWITETGEFKILVGASSKDIRLKENINLT